MGIAWESLLALIGGLGIPIYFFGSFASFASLMGIDMRTEL